MKKIIIILICAFALYQLAAQNNYQGYYYAGGKPYYWREDSTSANIIVRNMEHFEAIVRNLRDIFTDKDDEIWARNETNSNLYSIKTIQIFH